ncbi:MAG: TRAM domain-containing protein, partial [Fimbriimonadales bacterium]|nr:TRAM domain-containing protein [Fimbriimonadales bacterium]
RQLMKTQQAISRDLQARWVGRKMEVLVEGLAEFSENGKSERGVVGRSYRDAPEVDGVVYLRGRAQPGDFVEAEITGSTEYDLVGEVRSITRPFPWGKRLRLAGQK